MAKYDQTKIDYAKKAINIAYDLADPDDPAKQQSISASKKNEKFYNYIQTLDANYTSDFTSPQMLESINQAKDAKAKEFRQRDKYALLQHYQKRVNELVAKRDEFNAKRYGIDYLNEPTSKLELNTQASTSIDEIKNQTTGEYNDNTTNDTIRASTIARERGTKTAVTSRAEQDREFEKTVAEFYTNYIEFDKQSQAARRRSEDMAIQYEFGEEQEYKLRESYTQRYRHDRELEAKIACNERAAASQREANE